MGTGPALPTDVVPVVVCLLNTLNQRGYAHTIDIPGKRCADARSLRRILKRHLQISREIRSRTTRQRHQRAEKIQDVRRVDAGEEDTEWTLHDAARRDTASRQRNIVQCQIVRRRIARDLPDLARLEHNQGPDHAGSRGLDRQARLCGDRRRVANRHSLSRVRASQRIQRVTEVERISDGKPCAIVEVGDRRRHRCQRIGGQI